MEVSINKKSGMPDFLLDQKDIQDANEIQKMMNTKGWAVLMRYLTFGRETFIDSGKEGIKTRAKRDLSDIKWGVLKGFDEFMAIAPRIVKRAEEFNEAVKEAQNAGNEHWTGE